MIKKIVLALILTAGSALAQSSADNSVIGFYLAPGQTSGSFTCKSNNIGPCFVSYGATLPVSGSFTPSGNQLVNIDQTTQGTTNGVVTKTGSVTNTSPASRTLVALDVSTVTTGGTAVNALTAGHKSAGGFLFNPVGATIALCINEIGTASGTTSAGSTTCIQPGQKYTLTPSSGAVSVVSSDSAHPFSGYGLN